MNPVLSFCRAALLSLLLFPTGAAAQRIAFINPAGQLVTVAPDGTDSRTLTPQGRQYRFPAWSPVNDEVAVIGGGPEGSGVFTVRDRARAKPKSLYEDPAAGPIYLYWSPDGNKVGFLAQSEGSLELQIAATGGSETKAEPKKVASGNPLYWQWGRDSENLLVHTGILEGGEIAFYTPAGRTGKPLAVPGLFNAPGLSPSEKYLAYTELTAGATRIIVAGNTTKNAQLRREVPYEGPATLSWSPTGEKLAIMNPPAAVAVPYGQVRLLDAQTGDLTPLIETTVIAFFWSPDGNYIAYITPLRPQDDGQVARTPNTPYITTVGTRAARVVQEPLVLELRVVNVQSGKDRLLTAFAPTPLFAGQFLPFFDQYALSHRVWSPDSTALVLPMLGRGGSKVVVVPLSGKPKVLGDGEMPFWSR